MDYGLGRNPSPKDERDYRMADFIGRITPRLWSSSAVLDQGHSPHCVGFSWTGWGICTPVIDKWSNADGDRFYYKCKVLDGEPKAEDGSSVRTGAQVMKNEGRIQAYFFAHSIQEAAFYVSSYGPVVLGIDWYNQMFNPVNGIVKPAGGIAGGHAILWYGVDVQYATLRNSWGKSWGKNGDCKILLTDLQRIFLDNGEACAATEAPLSKCGSVSDE